jgi:hypothetical protein
MSKLQAGRAILDPHHGSCDRVQYSNRDKYRNALAEAASLVDPGPSRGQIANPMGTRVRFRRTVPRRRSKGRCCAAAAGSPAKWLRR